MNDINIYSKACPSGSVPYIIRKGDTLIQIADLYGSNVKDILSFNPTIDPNNLKIGEQICVPLTVNLYPTCPTSNYYIVTKEDTFNDIAKYFDVTKQQLYYANYGIDPNDLYEDQVLCIPVAPPPVNLEIDLNQSILNVLQNNEVMRTYPIEKVNPLYPVPQGTFIILNKQVDPGEEYGARWLGLSKAGLGIHGTDTPDFIEKLATLNSIILTDRDITELFNLVTVGTNVTIR